MSKLYINGRFLSQSITGVQKVAREFLVALDAIANEGVYVGEVVVLCPKNAVIEDYLGLRNIKLEFCGMQTGHAWEQIELPFYSRDGILLCLGNLAPLWSLFFNKSGVYTMVHDLSYLYFPNAYSFKFKLLYDFLIPVVLEKSKCVFTVSKNEYDSILKNYSDISLSQRLSYHQNGGWTSLDSSLSIKGFDDRKKQFLYVGSLTKRKNAEGLLYSAIQLVRKYPDLKFIFVGANGPSFEGVDLEIPDDVVGNIEFLGQVNDSSRIKKLYNESLALIFPSFYEASPLPPVEAMTLGCPVISSKINSLKERCGEAALYCEADNFDSIVSSAESILNDKNLWLHYSNLGIDKAKDYSWKKQANEIIKLMEFK